MKIVADVHIPFIQDYFGDIGELVLMPGRQMTAAALSDADLLIVRSVTAVNQALLDHSSVKWVGSVTAGADHLDLNWLKSAGIAVSLAHGFNAPPVADYVVSVIAALQRMGQLKERSLRAGIIGLGATGSLVAKHFQALGMTTFCYDPLRALAEPNFHSDALTDFCELDIISLHVPLTKDGLYPTYQMINRAVLQKQRPGCVLINASRGSVIHTLDLSTVGQDLVWCFDVWENEPNIDLQLLAQAIIATPHMAGYSLESKQRGMALIFQAACDGGWIESAKIPPSLVPVYKLEKIEGFTWQEVVLALFDPRGITQQMKQCLGAVEGSPTFDELRLQFNARHEFANSLISDVTLSLKDKLILKKLGFKVMDF